MGLFKYLEVVFISDNSLVYMMVGLYYVPSIKDLDWNVWKLWIKW